MTNQIAEEIRKQQIAAMPRKELNAHAYLCEREQEEYERQLQQLQEELERIKAERDVYKQGLEWYADEDTHEIKRRVLGDFAPISLDKGQRARDILAKYKGADSQ